jgi:hypothetical protein
MSLAENTSVNLSVCRKSEKGQTERKSPAPAEDTFPSSSHNAFLIFWGESTNLNTVHEENLRKMRPIAAALPKAGAKPEGGSD